MSKVLVTGGSGFLGSHIVDALIAQGNEVTVFDRKPSPYLKNVKFIEGDIRNVESISSAVKGCEAVFHLAALADLNEARNKPYETADINILGTINLLEASRLNNVSRFLFGSSVYVYSQQGGFYRCSKQACENYIEEYANMYDLGYTILRFGSLYGSRADETNGVYRLLKKFMNENSVVYSGSEDDKREYIHVEDAARLSVIALRDEYRNKHLTLTGNDRLTITELFKMFSEILNKNVSVKYESAPNNKGHYSITPYTFTPKLGKKLTLNEYVDMGQGLLQVIEEIHNKEAHA